MRRTRVGSSVLQMKCFARAFRMSSGAIRTVRDRFHLPRGTAPRKHDLAGFTTARCVSAQVAPARGAVLGIAVNVMHTSVWPPLSV